MDRKTYAFFKNKRLASKIFSILRYYSKRDNFDELLPNWIDEKNLKDSQYMSELKKDIIFSDLYYGIDPEEYLRYGFEKLSEYARWQYVGDRERSPRMHSISDPEAYEILKDKVRAYEKFKDYYKRDVIAVNSVEDLDKFEAFVAKHKEFIVKPNRAYGGRGIYRDEIKPDDDAKKILMDMISKHEHGTVIEELIIQAPEMAKFHPGSVNTIRLVTYNDKGKIRIVQTSVRIGLGDSVVDNGCLSSGVDIETGIIVTPGRCAHRKGLYVIHPETNIQILGSKIPQWEGLLKLAYELPNILPKQKIIGWDLALSTDGWVMIEANGAPMIQILAGEGVGMRKIYDEITR